MTDEEQQLAFEGTTKEIDEPHRILVHAVVVLGGRLQMLAALVGAVHQLLPPAELTVEAYLALGAEARSLMQEVQEHPNRNVLDFYGWSAEWRETYNKAKILLGVGR